VDLLRRGRGKVSTRSMQPISICNREGAGKKRCAGKKQEKKNLDDSGEKGGMGYHM